jgi:hypothetical protein
MAVDGLVTLRSSFGQKATLIGSKPIAAMTGCTCVLEDYDDVGRGRAQVVRRRGRAGAAATKNPRPSARPGVTL